MVVSECASSRPSLYKSSNIYSNAPVHWRALATAALHTKQRRNRARARLFLRVLTFVNTHCQVRAVDSHTREPHAHVSSLFRKRVPALHLEHARQLSLKQSAPSSVTTYSHPRSVRHDDPSERRLTFTSESSVRSPPRSHSSPPSHHAVTTLQSLAHTCPPRSRTYSATAFPPRIPNKHVRHPFKRSVPSSATTYFHSRCVCYVDSSR